MKTGIFLVCALACWISAAFAESAWEKCIRNSGGGTLTQRTLECHHANPSGRSTRADPKRRARPEQQATQNRARQKALEAKRQADLARAKLRAAKQKAKASARAKVATPQNPAVAPNPAQVSRTTEENNKTAVTDVPEPEAPKAGPQSDVKAAEALFKEGKIFSARTKVNQALLASPDDVDALLLKANLLVELDQLAEAITIYSRLIERGPSSPQLLYGRGRAHEKSGESEKAIVDYRMAIQMNAPGEASTEIAAQEKAFARLSNLQAKSVSATVGSAAVAPVAPKIAGKRIALVIGNSKYEAASPLKNPPADVRQIANKLVSLGFNDVKEVHDLNFAGFSDALVEFGDKAATADWALIYYAGHGIQVGGQNYMIPVNAKLRRASHVDDETIPLERILSKVREARKIGVVILDACRDNPFASRMVQGTVTRQVSRGLSRVEPVKGVLVAFSAREGQVALDGEKEHSPFAEALLHHMENSDVDLRLMFAKVRDSVLEKTSEQQEPWVNSSLSGQEFYINAKR